jgi:hypothetical protein
VKEAQIEEDFAAQGSGLSVVVGATAGALDGKDTQAARQPEGASLLARALEPEAQSER